MPYTPEELEKFAKEHIVPVIFERMPEYTSQAYPDGVFPGLKEITNALSTLPRESLNSYSITQAGAFVRELVSQHFSLKNNNFTCDAGKVQEELKKLPARWEKRAELGQPQNVFETTLKAITSTEAAGLRNIKGALSLPDLTTSDKINTLSDQVLLLKDTVDAALDEKKKLNPAERDEIKARFVSVVSNYAKLLNFAEVLESQEFVKLSQTESTDKLKQNRIDVLFPEKALKNTALSTPQKEVFQLLGGVYEEQKYTAKEKELTDAVFKQYNFSPEAKQDLIQTFSILKRAGGFLDKQAVLKIASDPGLRQEFVRGMFSSLPSKDIKHLSESDKLHVAGYMKSYETIVLGFSPRPAFGGRMAKMMEYEQEKYNGRQNSRRNSLNEAVATAGEPQELERDARYIIHNGIDKFMQNENMKKKVGFKREDLVRLENTLTNALTTQLRAGGKNNFVIPQKIKENLVNYVPSVITSMVKEGVVEKKGFFKKEFRLSTSPEKFPYDEKSAATQMGRYVRGLFMEISKGNAVPEVSRQQGVEQGRSF